jgi:hypothetical protein
MVRDAISATPNFDGRSETPFDNEQVAAAWDGVAASDPRITDHISGASTDAAISLAECVRAFHATAQTGPFALTPDQLAAVLGYFPEGGFAIRARSTELLEDVNKLWRQFHETVVAEAMRRQNEAEEIAGWLTVSDQPWDPETLTPRPWLAQPYLMRGEITLTHGPGGSGKSQLLIGWAVALSLGRTFGRLQPQHRCRVLLTNFEDNATEQMRRISAALQAFGATPANLKGWLYRVALGPKGDATMFELDDKGAVCTTACWAAFELACERIRPDVVIVDPLVAINAVPEANNQLMRRVMTVVRIELAQRFGCALVLAHHDTKSGGDDEDNDQTNTRGAGDIVNAARFELAVKKMTVSQADEMYVTRDRRGLYFRLGSVGSKLNYAAPEDSEWFERLAVMINGEATVRCIPWQRPSGRLDDAKVASLIAAIGSGTKSGPYSPRIDDGDRSLGPLLKNLGIRGTAAQRSALRDLLDRGVVVQASWRRPGHRDNRQGLRTAVGSPAKYDWQDGPHDADT